MSTPRANDRPAPWWVLVLIGVVALALGIGALLAYSYWGWDHRRVQGAAIFLPFLGLAVVVWGLGRGARRAAKRLRMRARRPSARETT